MNAASSDSPTVPAVTVVICTWNRSQLLDRTLTQLHRQQIPHNLSWELLVIDNNCTDNTAEIVRKHGESLPVRHIVETKQGHSHARNRGIDEAKGELILWTDDDVLVGENWIAEFARVAQEHPEAGFFGGRVTPWYADEVPDETRRMIDANMAILAPVYSLKDYGTDVRPFTHDEAPFGSNMAFRTNLLRQFRFDPNFGRVKTGLIGADEVSVLRRMQAAGITGVWIGTTEIRHYIPRERTTREHFWRYFVALGQTHVRLEGLPPSPTLFGQPRWALFGSRKLRVKAWWKRVRNDSSWLADYLNAAKLHGYCVESHTR